MIALYLMMQGIIFNSSNALKKTYAQTKAVRQRKRNSGGKECNHDVALALPENIDGSRLNQFQGKKGITLSLSLSLSCRVKPEPSSLSLHPD